MANGQAAPYLVNNSKGLCGRFMPVTDGFGISGNLLKIFS